MRKAGGVMRAWDVMENLSSPDMKQLVFFYELCKAGAVCFDMNNPAHAELIEQMSVLMCNSMDVEAHTKLEKAGKDARHKVYMAILCQIMAHIMPVE